jgi:hypothetical protein
MLLKKFSQRAESLNNSQVDRPKTVLKEPSTEVNLKKALKNRQASSSCNFIPPSFTVTKSKMVVSRLASLSTAKQKQECIKMTQKIHDLLDVKSHQELANLHKLKKAELISKNMCKDREIKAKIYEKSRLKSMV